MFRTCLAAAAAVCLTFCAAGAPARAEMVVGVFDISRATTANILAGFYTAEAVASLQENFPGTTFATTPTLTPSFLAGVDLLLIASPKTGDEPITPLSSSERSAMLNYVLAGGSALIVADGYEPFTSTSQSMVSPFGMSIADDNRSGVLNASAVAPSHPVFNGPFGIKTSFVVYGSGVFTDLGPATLLGTLDETGQPVLAAIEAGALGPNSGRVVVMADSSTLISSTVGGPFPQYEALFLNTIDYLSVPEPGGLLSVAIGGAALFFSAGFCRAARRGEN